MQKYCHHALKEWWKMNKEFYLQLVEIENALYWLLRKYTELQFTDIARIHTDLNNYLNSITIE